MRCSLSLSLSLSRFFSFTINIAIGYIFVDVPYEISLRFRKPKREMTTTLMKDQRTQRAILSNSNQMAIIRAIVVI